jgi:methylenetetrahydrofolate dehydrogenase (NADP+)/methenyltetrahydrofolate cyclohydrolase
MNNNQINCKAIYDRMVENIKADIEQLGVTPVFYILKGEENYGSNIYMNLKVKTAEECGIVAYIKEILPNEVRDKYIKDKYNSDDYWRLKDEDRIKLFNDGYIDYGVAILQLPASEKMISRFKDNFADVDYLNNYTLFNIIENTYKEYEIPATARGTITVLEEELGNLSGKKIAIVGCRSETVGKYLSYMLLNKNATVSLYHSKSIIKDGEFENYDAVVSCVGKAGLISQKHFGNNKGCICIDIGVSRGDDGKVKGDFDIDIREHQRFTPYVNGMGLLTRIFLMASVIGKYMPDKILMITDNGIKYI